MRRVWTLHFRCADINAYLLIYYKTGLVLVYTDAATSHIATAGAYKSLAVAVPIGLYMYTYKYIYRMEAWGNFRPLSVFTHSRFLFSPCITLAVFLSLPNQNWIRTDEKTYCVIDFVFLSFFYSWWLLGLVWRTAVDTYIYKERGKYKGIRQQKRQQ